jgi:hypothetical protein
VAKLPVGRKRKWVVEKTPEDSLVCFSKKKAISYSLMKGKEVFPPEQ